MAHAAIGLIIRDGIVGVGLGPVVAGVVGDVVGAEQDVAVAAVADRRDRVTAVPVRVDGVADDRRVVEAPVRRMAVVHQLDRVDRLDLAVGADDEQRVAVRASEDDHVGVPPDRRRGVGAVVAAVAIGAAVVCVGEEGDLQA